MTTSCEGTSGVMPIRMTKLASAMSSASSTASGASPQSEKRNPIAPRSSASSLFGPRVEASLIAHQWRRPGISAPQ